MEDPDQRTGTPAAGKQEADAESQMGQRQTRPVGPAAVPPDHLQFGPQSDLVEDPIVESVVADDWGPIPAVDADVEVGETRVLREGATI